MSEKAFYPCESGSQKESKIIWATNWIIMTGTGTLVLICCQNAYILELLFAHELYKEMNILVPFLSKLIHNSF
jgi:hypothetical protein